jgi:hypothetical protein
MPRISLAVLALLALALLLGPQAVRVYTDWLWFGEVGYRAVFQTTWTTQSGLFLAGFLTSLAWLGANIRMALSSLGDRRPTFITRDGLAVPFPEPDTIWRVLMTVATIVSILFGLAAAGRWESWLTFRHQSPFGDADPVLGHDVAYYVFSLPWWQFVRGTGQTLVVAAALAAGGLYLVTGSLTTGFPSRLSIRGPARRHLALLAAVFFLLLGWSAWLDRPELLLKPTPLMFGATYADVAARLPGGALTALVGVVAAGLAVLHVLTPRNWPLLVAAVLYGAVSVGTEIYASALQRFVVTPNEQSRESPYLQHNITATRRAFALDGVDERELTGDDLLTPADVAANAATLENVRLWDHQPLLDTFGQIQEIRPYYEFASVDNDRYMVNGRLRQVMLSARELNSASLPNRTWVNERLTFTHGYGLTLGPVNQVTREGLPVLFVRDLPPVSTADFPIDEPSLYFGEISSSYAIVRTKTREFHYPKGDENEFTQYTGRGGVPLDSLWRKLVFAVRFGAYQILLSDDVEAESRILFNRSIGARVRLIAPFLRFDQDPYLVVAGGRLYWIYDAYTTSGRYPYSTRVGNDLNYIRNSVKFVIDAYQGTTSAYLSDPADPVIGTYARIFPGLFKPMDEMPPDIRQHVRYPEDIFAVQARVFATFHMTEPAAFYNREDQWQMPTIEDGGEARVMQPYYTIMRLPGEPDPEFIQMLPFTPSRRDNLAAWLVARSDGKHYGQLRVFVFPKQKLVFGPRQVVGRMLQDQTISPQITLWNQQGSQVIWGTLMVIPVNESLIYVRPLYLRASGGRIPELTRVIVAYQNQIVMEPTLDQALARIFGSAAAPPATEARPTSASAPPGSAGPATPGAASAALGGGTAPAGLGALAEEAQAHYARAVEAQRAGDWAKYGDELRQLGAALERMRGAAPAPSAPAPRR